MSEESKPIAPGGASIVCEICGRERGTKTGYSRTGICDPVDALNQNGWDCYATGYERVRSSLSTAEKENTRQAEELNDLRLLVVPDREAQVRLWKNAHAEALAANTPLREERAVARQLLSEAVDLLRTVKLGLADGRLCEPGMVLAIERWLWAYDADPPDKPSGRAPAVDGMTSDNSSIRKLSGPVIDAPTAPKASDIASDSSALEKALGALRALLPWARRASAAWDDCDEQREAIALAREALSGGAHVDGPKAPKEEVK